MHTQHPGNTPSGRLDGKVAVVTGAARGIGRAIAERFAGEGAALVLGDLDGEAVGEIAEAIRSSSGVATMSIRVDVSERDENGSMIASGLERFGRLDILVCNAGVVHRAAPIEAIPPQQCERVIGINLMGAVWATQAFVPHAKARRDG